jgi:hypothetical protein
MNYYLLTTLTILDVARSTKPIKITVGAYQSGLWQNDGYKAAPTVYQSFLLLP